MRDARDAPPFEDGRAPRPGDAVEELETPCLVLDLDALERNLAKLRDALAPFGMRHRAHAKMHRSVDVARLQIGLGRACGLCCQKVSEAEVFARADFDDLLVSHEVRDPRKIDRLARLPHLGARTIVLVDDAANVGELAAAARRHGTAIECLVELDCGAGLCGVTTSAEVVALARAVDGARGLRFAGIQAYQGRLQHLESFVERREAARRAAERAAEAVAALAEAGFACDIVGGGGTGSWRFDAASGVYDELQCGSYAFLDADYGRIRDADDRRLDAGEWENALFVLASVVSRAKPGVAVVDAGLKSMTFESGPPLVFERPELAYTRFADEHGLVEGDAEAVAVLRVGDRLKLVPGHCDPTVNLHDRYVVVRGGRVEALWPVSARGCSL